MYFLDIPMGQFILFLMRYKISLSILLSRIHQVCRNSPRTADFIYHLVLLLEATMKTTLVEFFSMFQLTFVQMQTSPTLLRLFHRFSCKVRENRNQNRKSHSTNIRRSKPNPVNTIPLRVKSFIPL